MTPPLVRIGTSGWNYKHWRGIFYPNDLPASHWLEFYLRHFDTVEINYSFTGCPRATTSRAGASGCRQRSCSPSRATASSRT